MSLVQEDMYALEIGWGVLPYPSFYKPTGYALKKKIFINLFVVVVCIDFGNWKLKYTGRESIERLHSYLNFRAKVFMSLVICICSSLGQKFGCFCV